jgi:hypothetical protein
MRSGQSTVILRDNGFPRVANLHGGMLLWQQMGCRYCAAQALVNTSHRHQPVNIPFEQPIKFE